MSLQYEPASEPLHISVKHLSSNIREQVVSDDLEGVSAILSWLSFVPPVKGAALPILRYRPSDEGTT